jgi:hypothetical protein
MKEKTKTIIAGALGECVHGAGVTNFLRLAASESHERGIRFAFRGTPPVVERVRKIGFFERLFDGSEPSAAVLAYLKGQQGKALSEADFPQATIERIKRKSPYLILRHHFGPPKMERTID